MAINPTPDEAAVASTVATVLTNLRALRHWNGLSQVAAAARVGVAPSTLKSHEVGARALTLKALARYARAYGGWTTADLFDPALRAELNVRRPQ